MDFKPEHKEDVNYGNYFDYGVHKVKIIGFMADKTDDGKEFIEVGFTNFDGDIEDKARVWFSGDAPKYSFNTLRTIFLHNCPEDKKEAAKAAIDAVANTEKLVEMLNSKLVGKEMWFTKYQDPKRTYTGKDGVTRKSVDKSIYGYEPKLNEDLIPKKTDTVAAAKEVFPDATPAGEDAPPFRGGGSQESDWA